MSELRRYQTQYKTILKVGYISMSRHKITGLYKREWCVLESKLGVLCFYI